MELAESVGVDLYPWQRRTLQLATEHRRRPPYKYFSERVGLSVPRRSGKTLLLLLRGALEVLDGGHVIMTSDRVTKAQDVSEELFAWAEDGHLGAPEEWKIRRGGNMLLARNSRTGGSWRIVGADERKARTFKASLILFDEVALLPEGLLRGFSPLMATFLRRQMWFASNAGDETSTWWRSMWERERRRYLEDGRGDEMMAWVHYGARGEEDIDDVRTWMRANPSAGLPHGVDVDYLHSEHALAMADGRRDDWGREWCNLWPDLVTHRHVIDPEEWRACRNTRARMSERYTLAADADVDRDEIQIAAACLKGEKVMVELVGEALDLTSGAAELQRLARRGRPVILDARGPLSYLVSDLRRKRVDVYPYNWNLVRDAAVDFHERVRRGDLLHLGQDRLDHAVALAARRNVSDGRFAWARTEDGSSTPLVAASLACLGAVRNPPPAPPVAALGRVNS